MEEKQGAVRLDGRKKLSLTGVLEVVCFLEDHAEFATSEGALQITGEGLHMEKLDLEKGDVFVTGRVDSLFYPGQDEPIRKGLFQKLFS